MFFTCCNLQKTCILTFQNFSTSISCIAIVYSVLITYKNHILHRKWLYITTCLQNQQITCFCKSQLAKTCILTFLNFSCSFSCIAIVYSMLITNNNHILHRKRLYITTCLQNRQNTCFLQHVMTQKHVKHVFWTLVVRFKG